MGEGEQGVGEMKCYLGELKTEAEKKIKPSKKLRHTSSYNISKSWGVMYSMVTTPNNTVLHI